MVGGSVGGGTEQGGDPNLHLVSAERREREPIQTLSRTLAVWMLINHVWTADNEVANILDNVWSCLCFSFYGSILKLYI